MVTLILLPIFCFNFQVLHNVYVLFLKSEILNLKHCLYIHRFLVWWLQNPNVGGWKQHTRPYTYPPNKKSSIPTLPRKSSTFKVYKQSSLFNMQNWCPCLGDSLTGRSRPLAELYREPSQPFLLKTASLQTEAKSLRVLLPTVSKSSSSAWRSRVKWDLSHRWKLAS